MDERKEGGKEGWRVKRADRPVIWHACGPFLKGPMVS